MVAPQGRAFEIGRDGEVVSEVMNTKPSTEDANCVISELKWLSLDYFGGEVPGVFCNEPDTLTVAVQAQEDGRSLVQPVFRQ